MRKARSTAAFSVLSLMLLAGQAAPVLAVESPAIYNVANLENGSITITEPGQNLDYYAYQLFTGSWHGTQTNPNKLSEVKNGTENEGLSGLHFGEAEFGSATGPLVNGKYTGEYLINAIKGYGAKHSAFAINTNDATSAAQQVADYLGSTANKDLQTADFANHLKNYLKGLENDEENPITVTQVKGDENKDKDNKVTSVSFSNVNQGYYLIVTKPKNANEENLAHTTAMLVPVNGSVGMKSKSSLPTVEKTVKDHVGDTAPDWKETASVGLIKPTENGLKINEIEYQLKGKVAHNIEDYDSYKYSFVDTMPKGLDLGNVPTAELPGWTYTFRVTGKSTITSPATEATDINFEIKEPTKGSNEKDLRPKRTIGTRKVVVTDANGNETEETRSTLTWTFDDLIEVLDKAGIDYSYANADSIRVIVEYKPSYTTDQINSIWNEMKDINKPQINSVYVEFSNDPKTEGTGKTNEDDAKVYSFNLDLTKVDQDKQTIDGAQFELETKKLDEDGNPVKDDKRNFVFIPAGKVIDVKDANGKVIPGRFNFTGLDAGVTYRLTESVTPDGYKKIEPIEFWIEAIHAEDGKTIKDIKVHIVENKNNAFGLTGTKNDDRTFTFLASATAVANVVNTKGPNMPVTGQAGIWTGVAVGGLVLAVSAVAILKNKKEEA